MYARLDASVHAAGGERTEGELAVAGSFNARRLDSDRVARRETVTVTTTGHAIPTTMSILDAGELANVPHGFSLRKWETVASYLPQTEGLLPKWQLIAAVLAFFNAAQNFVTLDLTRRIYGNVAPPLGSKFRVTLLATAPADEGRLCLQ